MRELMHAIRKKSRELGLKLDSKEARNEGGGVSVLRLHYSHKPEETDAQRRIEALKTAIRGLPEFKKLKAPTVISSPRPTGPDFVKFSNIEIHFRRQIRG